MNNSINDYISFWDNFDRFWFESFQKENAPSMDKFIRTLSADKHFEMFLKTGKLDPNELPEPYQGDPEKAKFIIINLNPGKSCGEETAETAENESSKFLSNYGTDFGKQINAFADNNTYDMTYSKFIREWACLLPKNRNTVCGGTWWQGKNGNGGRMKWIRSFAKQLGKGEIANEEVFAMEVCPFHSVKWSNSIICRGKHIKEEMKQYLSEKIFSPAKDIAKQNDIKCIVCVGSLFNTILSDLYGSPTEVWNGTNSPMGLDWPLNEKSENCNRSYALFKEPAYGIKFLVISSSGSNKLPGDDFSYIDNAIASLI